MEMSELAAAETAALGRYRAAIPNNSITSSSVVWEKNLVIPGRQRRTPESTHKARTSSATRRKRSTALVEATGRRR